jgi:hypothetical protein
LRVFPGKKDFTLQSLIDAAYDTYLPSFDRMIPALLKAYDDAPASNPLKGEGRRPDRGASRLGLSMVRVVGADVARHLLR